MPDFIGELQFAKNDDKAMAEAIKGVQERQKAYVKRRQDKGVKKQWTPNQRYRKSAFALLAALDHQALLQ